MFRSEMTVVLVEQDPACAALIADGLRDAEREPLSPRIKLLREHALDGGMIEAEGRSADVLLVDVAVLKDEEAADALLHTLQALPVILFSAGESSDHGLRALRNGACDYLDRSRLSGPVLLRSILYAIERQRGESALRQSERRYQQLLQSINSYTYSVEVAAGQAISTRHGPGCLATTGYAPADYEADPFLWFRMIYPEDRPTVLQHLAKLENGERISPVEHRILHRDGTIRWIRNSAIPSYDAIGQLCHYDGLVEDITARKLAELALRKNEAELLAARDVQQRLLPAQPPPLPGCDLAGASFPCDTVGGDYFDYLPMLDDRVGIVIADGSGHGLAPALLAAELRATLRTLVQTYRTPAEIITLANRILFPGMADGYFITVLFACIQPRDRAFSFISAGHPLPVILDQHGNMRDVPPASGLPIGVLETPTFASGATIRLNDGDTVLLWSDGMYEVASPGGPMLGPEALVDLVRQHLRRPAREIIEALHDAVTAYGGPRNPQDDMTIVVLKVQAIGQEGLRS
jgi:PAS domain S-box-containing protein